MTSKDDKADVPSVRTIFNFDYMMTLYKEDPGAFREMTRGVLHDFIETAPDQYQQNLEHLQCRVDMIADSSANPLQACIRISSLMRQSLNDLHFSLNDPSGLMAERAAQTDKPKAKVLQIKPR